MSRLAFADMLLRDAAALVIVKATVVLALASAAAAGAIGLSAARRHLVWLVALSSCVWLVLSSPVVPAIAIHTPMVAESAFASEARATPAASPASRSAAMTTGPRASRQFARTNARRPSPGRSIPLPSHPLVVVWIIGCIALIIRHAIGFAGTMRLARRASVANDDEAMRELADAAAAVGVRREIRLGYSPQVRSPVTFDVVKPYVLLPTEARSWPIERRRAVLVHEAAHIERGDWLSQAIGRFACELLWFHPLAWRAFAHLRDDAERAADDAVLRSGMPAVAYATHLLELARRTSNTRPDLVAVGIVSMSDLERRFRAMFDATRSRATVSSRARAVTAGLAVAIVCPLASLRLAAPLQPTKVPPHHVSAPRPSSDARATIGRRVTARVTLSPEVRAATISQSARGTSQSRIALAQDLAPSRSVHPDFSGKWTQDTVAGAVVDNFTTDSSTITQSATAISIESRGHGLFAPTTSTSLRNVTFDGVQANGITMIGDTGLHVVARAVWAGDTLLVTSYAVVYAGGGIHDLLNTERMTLSADGNTLFDTNLSMTDGRVRWGGPQTFVLRRAAP